MTPAILVACEPFGLDIDAARVAAALGGGLAEGGWEVDRCALASAPAPGAGGGSGRAARDALVPAGFDGRLRASRALVVATAVLSRAQLAGGAIDEAATRARQGGVPCFAVAGRSELDAFGARVLDLQLVLEARTPRELRAAGRELAERL